MTDEELIARLRYRAAFGTPTATAAADRIEELVREAKAAEKKIANIRENYDAVFARAERLEAHGITVASFDPKSWGSEQACIEAAWAHAYVSPNDRITVEGLRGAVARGWCAPENSSKEMDPDLAEAIVREVYELLQLMSPNDPAALKGDDHD